MAQIFVVIAICFTVEKSDIKSIIFKFFIDQKHETSKSDKIDLVAWRIFTRKISKTLSE